MPMNTEKKIEFVSFDFDGTIVEENSWTLFNTACGVTPQEDKQYYDAYHDGKITYDQWIEAIVLIWKQRIAITPELGAKLGLQFTLRAGVLETIAWLKEHAYKVVIVTGGVDIVIRPFLQSHGIIDMIFTTECVFEKGVFKELIHHSKNENVQDASMFKLDVFRSFLRMEHIDPSVCMHVGDGSNDIGIFDIVAKPVFFGIGNSLNLSGYPEISHMKEIQKLVIQSD